MGQSMLPLVLCDFFLFPLYHCRGSEPSSGHFGISEPLSCAVPYSHRTLMAAPMPLLTQGISICWGWQLSSETPSLSVCPFFRSTARGHLLCSHTKDSLCFWSILVALISLKPHISVPVQHLKWCHEQHLLIMLQVHFHGPLLLQIHSHGPPLPQVSLLHACLALGNLPCYLPSHHTLFPSSS